MMLVWLLAAVLQGGAATLAGAEGLSQARSVPIDANSVMIVGVDAQKRAVIRVVDVKTGTVRVETQGTSPRWYPQQRYVLHRRDASWYAFHVPSGRLEGPLSQLEVFERSIRFGNPLERRGTLQNVLKDSAARESAAIQSAVLDRLRSELATPLPGGTDEAELRRRRAREIEIELLLRFLGRANVSEAASLIASADIEAARGALLDFGRPSIQAVLDAWKNPRVGASAAYRPRLLETLHQLALIYPDAVSLEVRTIVRGVLLAPSNIRAALAAIRFADDLDDSEALKVVRQYATDHIFTAERLPSSADAQLARAAASDILARRITIR